ncbi:hypothetical protein TDSAC_0422 [Thermodesulfobium acidiphilum]|uniref:4-vinyl reductase 4VR domain-containing protein n=1 Tax=Thermodesulfobium acidiphilum TaxID=1794699 RepID=A0A2R4VZC5_THEAF|nr:hypothetical protein [Thermodesulfobium acidiphilum]AWB09798.1 hypothetical protein TDSAC_0422 [Thermodesulfobium acidiphilum]
MKSDENVEQGIIDKIGNIDAGRPNLGLLMPVFMYRFFFISVQEKLKERFGQSEADRVLFDAGFLAGNEFCETFISAEGDVKKFLVSLQTAFKEQRLGVLQLEDMDLNSLYFEISILEDVYCSGVEHSDRFVCSMCEGFLAGIFSFYFKRIFEAKELEAWTGTNPKSTFELKPKKIKKSS